MIKALNYISSQESTPLLPSDLHLHPPQPIRILPTSLSDPNAMEAGGVGRDEATFSPGRRNQAGLTLHPCMIDT